MKVCSATPTCGPSVYNNLCSCGRTLKVPLQTGETLFYNGPNLPGSGVNTCDSINEAIQKLDTIILELRQKVLTLEQNQ